MLGAAKITPSISNLTSVDEEAKKKTKIQNAIKQFIQQLKTGCNKAICFNKYCRKNKFGKCLSHSASALRPEYMAQRAVGVLSSFQRRNC